MDASSILPPRFNLTGQVAIQGYMPDFTGNYSCVYRGIVHGKLVAVKIIKATGEPESMKRKVLRERTIWGSLNHRNIHPFYGFADDQAFAPFGALVSPWSAKGDASRFLRENGERMIVAERMNLWKGVIEGVIYLHDQQPPIVHGDLKPGNVLIDDFGVPKICDFGLARIFLEQGSTGMTTTSEHTGTARYLAPELVASDVTVYPTLASDVYALGCLGLEFIYLQQPFPNHVNNLRGQIFRDLRKGLPPAAKRPPQAWPSVRAWLIIVKCWGLDPHSRPSAFAAGRMVRCTAFNFPLVVVQRIAHFVDADLKLDVDFIGGTDVSVLEWNRRCRCLRNLCLVSNAYRRCTTPFLYREIHLDLESRPQRLPALLSALESSATKVLLSPQEPDGYGTCTKSLILFIAADGPYHSHLSVGIRDLVNRLPGLQLTHILRNSLIPPLDVPALSTLRLWNVDLSILFDHIPTIQALESARGLSIGIWHDSGFSTGPLRQPFSRIHLPNLLEIYHHAIPLNDLFSIISNWTMPGLISLHFVYISWGSLSPLLQTHGAQLENLTLKCHSLSHQDTLDLLNLCSGLRSLDVEGEVSLSGVFSSHPRLEKIKVDYRPSLYPFTSRRIESVLEPLKSLRLRAQTSFPNLVETNLLNTYRGKDRGSFRTVDQSITYWDGNKTYRLHDGQDTFVELPENRDMGD